MFVRAWTLAILLTACPVLAAAGPSQLPFRLAGPYILVDVLVNGEHRAVFCLDTASSITLINDRLAKHLKVPIDSARRVVTQTGVEQMRQGRLSSLRVGPLTVSDLSVTVTKLSPITAVAPTVGGVIGQDVVGTTSYLVDYREGLIEFERARRVRRALVGTTVPVARVGRRLLVQAWLTLTTSAEAVPMLLALDSAASAVTLFERTSVHDAPLRLEGRTKPVWVHSVEGSQKAVKGVAHELTVGGHVLRRVPVTVMDMPEGWQDHGQHGLLPTSAFDAIYFDHGGQAVLLNPQRLDRTVAVEDDGEANSPEQPRH